MANEVFISYSRLDIDDVKAIKDEIENEVGIECWFDLDGIESGEQFEDVIIEAICRHDTVLFMKSANSMHSEWALDELDFAKHENKRIVLVHLDETEMTKKFYFRYHKYDQIVWADKNQHDKLLQNLKEWFPHKTKQTKEESSPSKKLEIIDINGRYGFADQNNNVVIPCTWSEAKCFSEGLAAVKDDSQLWGFIDVEGVLVIPTKWKSVESFFEGLAVVSEDVKKYGCINKKGELVIEPIWQSLKVFSEGLAPVMNNKKRWGYINKEGHIVVDFLWADALSFTEGYAGVLLKEKKGLWKEWTFIDKKGNIVYPQRWNKVLSFSEGLAPVRGYDLKWGYINKDGETVIKQKWYEVGPFVNGFAEVVDFDYNHHIINIKGEFVREEPNIHLELIKKKEKFGFVDDRGKIAIPCLWDDAMPFKEGLAAVKRNNRDSDLLGLWGSLI